MAKIKWWQGLLLLSVVGLWSLSGNVSAATLNVVADFEEALFADDDEDGEEKDCDKKKELLTDDEEGEEKDCEKEEKSLASDEEGEGGEEKECDKEKKELNPEDDDDDDHEDDDDDEDDDKDELRLVA